jgi:hypothetical protein
VASGPLDTSREWDEGGILSVPLLFLVSPMTDFKRNPSGWLPLDTSRELLRMIFPNYPDLSEKHPLPQWVRDKLEEK